MCVDRTVVSHGLYMLALHCVVKIQEDTLYSRINMLLKQTFSLPSVAPLCRRSCCCPLPLGGAATPLSVSHSHVLLRRHLVNGGKEGRQRRCRQESKVTTAILKRSQLAQGWQALGQHLHVLHGLRERDGEAFGYVE